MKTKTSLLPQSTPRIFLPLLVLLFVPLLLCQCANVKDVKEKISSKLAKKEKSENPKTKPDNTAKKTPNKPSSKDIGYRDFTKSTGYPKTLAIYQNPKLLIDKRKKVTKIIINRKHQRLTMLVGDIVALDTPCSTGRKGKTTPKGSFKVTEKIKLKRSNIYGSAYHLGSKVCRGDRRNCPYYYDSFVGASIPYWLRLTGDGIGIHASQKIGRYPNSNGCIRLPVKTATTVYYMTPKGTPVVVR